MNIVSNTARVSVGGCVCLLSRNLEERPADCGFLIPKRPGRAHLSLWRTLKEYSAGVTSFTNQVSTNTHTHTGMHRHTHMDVQLR